MRASVVFGLFLSVIFPAVAESGVKISLQARSQQPGELILVTVETAEPSSVTAKALDTDVRFFPASAPTMWHGLVGLDVDLQPGEYPLEVNVVSQSGAATRETRMLRISRRMFPARHLRLPEKYVNPPAEVLERIRLEAEELKAIFSTVSPERLWVGGFRRPLSGVVISSFGKRSILNGQPRGVHAGVDLRARTGTPLRAPAGGRVVLTRELYHAGRSIILDHGLGLYSHFAHLSAFQVKEGQLVRQGEVIGFTGRSGRVQGPHLHWSVKLSNRRIDPISVLSILAESQSRRPAS